MMRKSRFWCGSGNPRVASPSSIEQILRTATPQVRAICLSLLRQLAKAKKKK